MMILIEIVKKFTEEEQKGFVGQVQMIPIEDIDGIRPWHLKGRIKELYPKDFSLLTLKNGNKIKVAEDIHKLDFRMSKLKGYGEE